MKKDKRRCFFSAVALLLVLIFSVEMVPVSAAELLRSALRQNDTSWKNDGAEFPGTAEEPENAGQSDVYVLGEDESLRDGHTKYFRLSDGSYVAAAYEETVHFQDETGTWQEIDNRLQESASGDDGFVGMENRDNHVKIKFASQSAAAHLYRLKEGKYSVFVGVDKKSNVKPNKVSAVVRQNETETGSCEGLTVEEAISLRHNISSVRYPGIWENTDLEYVINGTTVKENIYILQRGGDYSYSFGIKLKNLTPVLREDGSIALNDSVSGEPVYLIPAPYLYDAAGVSSGAASYHLESRNGNNQYTLTVSADKDWVNREDRVFPVTLDPILVKDGLRTEVRDTFVKEGSPNTVSPNGADILYLGYDDLTAEQRRRVYTKYNSLPELPSSAIVTQALLHYFQMPAGSPGYSGTNGLVVTAREVTGSWDSATIKWSNQPSFSSTVLDYIVTGSNTNGTFLSWDITSAVQKWYAGSANHGIVLMPDVERSASSSSGVNANVRLASSDNANLNYVPALAISYRDSKGLENYWTYETFDCGDAGTAYINVFNRNLTFVYDLYQTPGNILPISVSIVYNSSLAGKLGSDQNTVNKAQTLWVGEGNKLNIYEKLYTKTISGRLYYIHEDADGTEHYYYQNGKIVSEDGLSTTIVPLGTSFAMMDPDGYSKIFNLQGNLGSIRDKYGNSKNFYYTSEGYLTGISEQNAGSTEAKQLVTFSNQGSSNQQIYGTQAGTDKYSLSYSAGKMTAITHYSRNSGSEVQENKVEIGYDSAGRLSYVRCTKNDDKLTFSYDSRGRLTQVVRNKNGICVGKYGISDYGDKTVRFRSWGKDEIYGNGDDLYTVYTCDNYGRVISSYMTDLNGNVLGAAASRYNNAEGTKKHHTVAESSVKKATSQNSFLYSNFEAYSNANPLHDASNQATNSWMNYTTEKAYLGKRSLKLHFPNTGTGSAYTSLSLTAGKTYCFSVYASALNLDAEVLFRLTNSAATQEYGRVTVERGTTDAAIENGWQRVYFTATVPTTGSYTLWQTFNGTGTVYLDCMQFEEGTAPGRYNMIEWTSYGNGQYATSALYDASGYSIPKAWKMNGGPTQVSFFSQVIDVKRPGTDTYMLSFWAQSNSVRIGTDPTRSTTKRTFEVTATIDYTDGTNEIKRMDINPQNRSKQFVTMPIVPNAVKTVDHITIGATYHYNANASYLGDFTLTLEPAQAYTYDSDGNLKTAQSATGKSLLTYAENNLDLLKSELPNGDSYTYTYKEGTSGFKSDVASVTSKNNVKVAYEYDAYGNIKRITGSNTAGGKIYSNFFEYGDNGNYLTVKKDASLNSTTYDYDYSNGLLKSVTDALGNKTAYLYNGKGQVDKIFADGNKNGTHESSEAYIKYTYSGNLLTNLNKGNLQYGFLYDTIGNLSQVKVEGREDVLASYTYSTAGGYLTKITYGNGDILEYTYDKLGRLTALSSNGVRTCEYVYNTNGDLYEIRDLENEVTQVLEYDSQNRPVRMREKRENGTALALENQYDAYGRALQTTYSYSGIGRTYRMLYRANSDLIQSISLPNTAQVSYTYDHLERVNGKTVRKSGDTTLLAGETYEYGGGYEPPTVGALIRKVTLDVSDTEYEYLYDGLNNITQIKKNGQIIRLYTYDSLNQMTSETIIAPGAETGTRYLYAYDAYGNILSRRPCSYTVATGETGSVGAGYGYTYGDSTWKDLLTSYATNQYTYDELGNLTREYDTRRGLEITYSWEKGRRLAGMVRYGKSFAYTYNADGIRTGKSIPEGSIQYIVDGTKILSQIGTGTGKTLDFYYDAAGQPTGFRYNGEDYYYGKNVQGDVVELYHNGALIAEYEYDAWGNAYSIKDASGNSILDIAGSTHIASINPIRYRGYYYDVETNLYYLNSRYYNPLIGRFINADDRIAAPGGAIRGYNLYSYCFNNPVNMRDPSGHWPQWLKDVGNAIKSAATEVANFFSPKTNTISGSFQEGIAKGSGSLTGGYSEFNWRIQDNIKSSGSQDGWLGGFAKVSGGNANGKVGIGNNNVSASLKGVGDALAATAQAGVHYKDGLGIGAKAKASVLSGRATTEFEIFGWQIELGVSGDLLSAGAEATIGIFPDEGFKVQTSAGLGLFGGGFVFRVKAPG